MLVLFLFRKQREFLLQEFSYQRIQCIGTGGLCLVKNKSLSQEFVQQGIDIGILRQCSSSVERLDMNFLPIMRKKEILSSGKTGIPVSC